MFFWCNSLLQTAEQNEKLSLNEFDDESIWKNVQTRTQEYKHTHCKQRTQLQYIHVHCTSRIRLIESRLLYYNVLLDVLGSTHVVHTKLINQLIVLTLGSHISLNGCDALWMNRCMCVHVWLWTIFYVLLKNKTNNRRCFLSNTYNLCDKMNKKRSESSKKSEANEIQ